MSSIVWEFGVYNFQIIYRYILAFDQDKSANCSNGFLSFGNWCLRAVVLKLLEFILFARTPPLNNWPICESACRSSMDWNKGFGDWVWPVELAWLPISLNRGYPIVTDSVLQIDLQPTFLWSMFWACRCHAHPSVGSTGLRMIVTEEKNYFVFIRNDTFIAL